MRDLSILCILIACVLVAFYRPWLGVLALAVFGYLQPQTYASGFMQTFPVYKILFGVAVVALLIKRQWRWPPSDWRVAALIALWAYFLFTTYHAKVQWAAWSRFGEISSIFLMVGLTLVLIDTRQKLFFLIVIIAVSFALVTIKGGYWAVVTGFADRVYGPPGSQYYDNNMFAVAVIMNIPLLVLWLRETRHQALRYALMAAIALSGAAALSSWSRGALISLGATTAVLLWYSKRKYLTIPLLVGSIALAAVSLPEAWFERMQTIASHEHEGSAQSRLDVWQVGLKHAQLFPLTGVGADGWHYAVVTMDWHNAYVEMMAEHGFIAFGIWCLLLFGTMASLVRLGWRTGRSPEHSWVRNYSQMLTASLVAYASGSMFLGLSYWDILYQLVAVAILLSELARKADLPEAIPLTAAAAVVTPRQAPRPWLWNMLLILALAFTLAPLDTRGRIDPNLWLDAPLAYFTNLPAHFYQLIKTAILWVPVGFLYTLAGGSRVIKIWAPPVILALLVAASATLPDPSFQTVLETLYAIPGLVLGVWLASRTTPASAVVKSSATSGRGVSPPASAITHGAIESNVRGGDGAPSGGRATLPLGTHFDSEFRYAPQDAIEYPPRPLSAVALLARRAFALIVIGAAGWALFDFPRWNVLLAGGFVLYLALLWRYPKAWLVIVPAALPVLDLAFWTGRFFLDEFDLLLAVTLGALLWRAPVNRTDSGHSTPLILATLLMASVLISGLTGLLPLQPLDANAFSSYFSHYNSLRVAKGFLWGMVLFAMLRPHLNEVRPMKLLSAGMLIGLAGVAISALWEFWRFSGSSAPDYRVTATFSSMHIGGGHIEAYLVFALPFAWTLLLQEKRTWIKAVAMGVFFLAIYALLTTVARGGIVALAVVFAVLALGVYRTLRARGMSRTLRYTASAALIAGVVLVIAGLSTATFLQQRFTQTEADAQTRFAHWTHALGLLQNNWGERLFGAGLGTFPGRYFYANFDSSLGNYRYQTEGSNRYLSLNSGGTLYMAQSVAVTPGTSYTLELDVRSNDQTKQLDVPICEKKLLNSHLCQWLSVPVASGKGWQHQSIVFSSDQVGQGAWWARRPVQLSLFNPQEKGVVDVDNIRLLDRSGANLISNGDFAQGGDYWFFKSGNHLPWHTKNMWIHLVFEQGLVGLAIFCVLVIAAVWRLMRGSWVGESLATVWLAGISGLLTIGFVDSLLDTPRLAMLLVLALLVGASHHSRRNASR